MTMKCTINKSHFTWTSWSKYLLSLITWSLKCSGMKWKMVTPWYLDFLPLTHSKRMGSLIIDKEMAMATPQINSPSTLMRFRRPPFSKASVYIWPPTRKRSSKREVFKNGGLQKRFWTWRLLKTKVYRSRRVDGENEGFSTTRDVIIICMRAWLSRAPNLFGTRVWFLNTKHAH